MANRRGQKDRTPVREIARILNNVQAAIRAAGSVGIRQAQLTTDFADKAGISRGVVDREIIRLLGNKTIRNDSGTKRNRVLVWNLPAVTHEPQTIEAMALADAALAHMAKAQMNLEVTVLKDPPGLMFSLNGVNVTVRVP